MQSSRAELPAESRGRIRPIAIARLLRLPNVFTAVSDIGIGVVVGGEAVSAIGSACLLAASASFYCCGMVWNDFCDRRIDAIERPFRPIPSREISAHFARVIAILLTISGLVFGTMAGWRFEGWSPEPLLVSLPLLAMILAYNAGMRSGPMAPLLLGGCRFANVLLGFSTVPADVASWPLRSASGLAVGIYVAGITIFARDEAKTSDVRRLRTGLCVSCVGILTACLAPVWSLRCWSGGIYLIAVLGVYLWCRAEPVLKTGTPADVQSLVKRALLAIIVLDAGLASGAAGPVGLLVIGWLCPALYLARSIYST